MMTLMHRALRCSLLGLAAQTVASPVFAQATTPIPLTADAWDLEGLPGEFTTYRGAPALRLGVFPLGPEHAVATPRDFAFGDGTLEFDFAPTDSSGFAALHFRRASPGNSEHVYLRNFFPGERRVNETFQYAAVVDGVNYWDLSPEFQAAVEIDTAGWNHVKLVVRGRQLLAYVNDDARPVLYVPRLDGPAGEGGVGFAGAGYYANLAFTPRTEGLAGGEGYDPTLGDGRYLRRWRLAPPRPIEPTRALSTLELPDSAAFTDEIAAERLGLVNLSRPFGKTAEGERRVVWLRQTVTSATVREVEVDLGFSDDVAVWVNGRLAYVDENAYGTPQMKC